MVVRALTLLRTPIGLSLWLRVSFVALSFVLTVSMTRFLDVKQFGIFSFCLSASLLMVGLAQAGGVPYLVRETARSAGRDTPMRLLIRVCGVSVISGVVLSFGFVFLNRGGTAAQAALATPLIVVSSLLAAFFGATTRGASWIVRGQIPDALLRPLFVIGGLWVLGGTSLLGSAADALWLYAGGALVAAVAALVLARKALAQREVEVEPAIDRPAWRRGLLRLALAGWVGSSTLYLPPILTGLFGSVSDVGLLRVAMQFAAFSLLGLSAVEMAQAPAFSAAARVKDFRELHNLLQRSCKMAASFALGIGLLLGVMAGPTIRVLLSPAYEDALPALFIILGGQAVSALTGNLGTMLIACDLEGRVLLSSIGSLVVLLILSALLIPGMGAMGAAIAYALALSFRNVANAIVAWKLLGIRALPFARVQGSSHLVSDSL